MMAAVNTEASFLNFLEQFNKSHSDPVDDERTFPFRIIPEFISLNELEGEIIDWILQYLYQQQRKCPCILVAHLARQIADNLLISDLSEFQAKSVISDGDPQYEAYPVARETFQQLIITCRRWFENLPRFTIPADGVYDWSVCAIKNVRRKMEDRHVIVPVISALYNDVQSGSYFGVFDGHGGSDASAYTASQLLGHLVKHCQFDTDEQTALREAYNTTDKLFSLKAEREDLRSGSTGVSVLLRDKKLHIAWLGDSQVLLVRNGKPVEIMSPHKPEREDEKLRIEALGGCVLWYGTWRVNGGLSVSRAIGDIKHKPYVSSDADVATLPLEGSEDYIVLACDGLWDCISFTQLIQTVYDSSADGQRADAAQRLVDIARENGSMDNISVIVVFLRDNISKPDLVTTETESIQQRVTDSDNTNDGSDDRKSTPSPSDTTSAAAAAVVTPSGGTDNHLNKYNANIHSKSAVINKSNRRNHETLCPASISIGGRHKTISQTAGVREM
ncbi:protein phosphatase 1E-like [Tubulanus polymorphus]|uniref:protein phosphatase 1E-like n=1 Tax=Tubulanus polymorphus TaxID=672921 RepID=UPI003DA4A436